MQSQEASSNIDWLKSSGPWIFALLSLIAYTLFLRHLINHADPKTVGDEYWMRLIFLFGSIEAIAFAAAGFIFGREVNRARAVSAEQRANKADEEANRAKQVNKEILKEIIEKLPDSPPPDIPLDRFQAQAFEDIKKSVGSFITRT